VKEQQADLEAEARRREELQREAREVGAAAQPVCEPPRQQQDLETASEAEISRLRQALEESLRSCESEVSQLRLALEDKQRGCSEAQADLATAVERADELEELVRALKQERAALREERQRLLQERDDWQRQAAEAEEATRSASEVHRRYKQDMERLRPDLVTNAIRSKIELHICVPRVALECPDSPPVIVDMTSGLSREHVRKFLQNKVFPHFDPLWTCLDGVDRAPDGTNKKAYTSRILEILTDRLKAFVDEFRCNEDNRPDKPGAEVEARMKGPRSNGGSSRARRTVQN